MWAKTKSSHYFNSAFTPTSLKLRRVKATKSSAFTIIELLVVIVVIGVLAAIIVVSYVGVTERAAAASMQSDLATSAKTLELYYVDHDSVYPTTMTDDGNGNYCPTPVDTKYCVKASGDNTLTYSASSPYDTYTLTASNPNSTDDYQIVPGGVPTVATPAPSGPETVTIGTQTWMKYNINEGTMVNASATPQTLTQKWCYNNLESNCTTYGGLYQWNTAMQGSTTEGAQGICPDGFHVPTDGEWKVLEMELGMSQAEADTMGDRGSDEGDKIREGGSSGFNFLLGGAYDGFNAVGFAYLNSYGYIWSSSTWTSMSTFAYNRNLNTTSPSTIRYWVNSKTGSNSVRCLGN